MNMFEQLKTAIRAAIRPNGTNSITGQVLQNALVNIIDAMGNTRTLNVVYQETTMSDLGFSSGDEIGAFLRAGNKLVLTVPGDEGDKIYPFASYVWGDSGQTSILFGSNSDQYSWWPDTEEWAKVVLSVKPTIVDFGDQADPWLIYDNLTETDKAKLLSASATLAYYDGDKGGVSYAEPSWQFVNDDKYAWGYHITNSDYDSVIYYDPTSDDWGIR